MSGRRLLTLLAVVLLGASCAREVRVPPRPVEDARLILFMPLTMDAATGRVLELLRDMYPDAEWRHADEWGSGLAAALAMQQVVVIPDARTIPSTAWAELQTYLNHGGRALFIGTHPFAEPAVPLEGRTVQWATYEDHLTAGALSLTEFSAIQLWRHEQSGGTRRSHVRIATDRTLPWPGVEVDVHQLHDWDYMELPEPCTVLQDDRYAGAALAGYFRGGRDTTRVFLQATETDGSVWGYAIPVQHEWQRTILRARDWFHLRGGTGRGGPDDGLALHRLAGLRVGLDKKEAPQSGGSHRYGISDLRVIPADAMTPLQNLPDAPLVADPTTRFPLEAHQIEAVRSRARLRVRDTAAMAVRGDPTLHNHESGGWARWVPLFQARDRAGENHGDVAGIFLRGGNGVVPEHWAWIGLEPTRSAREALQTMISECLFFLLSGHFVVSAPLEQHLFEHGAPLTIPVQAYSLQAQPPLARVAADLLDADERIIRRVISPPFTIGNAATNAPPHLLNLGSLPTPPRHMANYRVQINLEEVGGEERLLDRVHEIIKVQGTGEVAARDPVRLMGTRLTSTRASLFLVQVDYDPALINRPSVRWLSAEAFPGERVQADLDRLSHAGANAIALIYADPAHAPQLRYVIEEARSRGLWVQIRLPQWSAWLAEPGKLVTALESLQLRSSPTVYSLDLTPAVHTFPATRAEGLDAAWTTWLRTQYGDIATANVAWRQTANPTFPYPLTADSREALQTDPALAALVRRFAATVWSREFGRAARTLRRAGFEQLLTARWDAAAGDLLARNDVLLPFDPEAAGAHLDFLTVVPDYRAGSEHQIGSAGFQAAYARGLIHERPLMWGGMRLPVGREPRRLDLDLQADRLEKFFQMALATQASGGGISQLRTIAARPLDADEGVQACGGGERPALRTLAEMANRARTYLPSPVEWGGREMAAQMGARGWADLEPEWASVYRTELATGRIESIRPAGYGRWSIDTPSARIGDGAHGPFQYMNAEWGLIRINREDIERGPTPVLDMQVQETMQAELINTGLARWSPAQPRVPGTVWVEIRRTGHTTQYYECAATPPGGRFWVDWQPVDPGVYRLRAWWLEHGGFGDVLDVHVRP
jgi:hypothetical protein